MESSGVEPSWRKLVAGAVGLAGTVQPLFLPSVYFSICPHKSKRSRISPAAEATIPSSTPLLP